MLSMQHVAPLTHSASCRYLTSRETGSVANTKRYVTADNGFSRPLSVAALVTLLSTRYVVPPMSPFQSEPSVVLRRGRAYAHVGGVAAQVLSWAISALASSKSLRMIAVIATFGGLPAWQSW